MNNDEKLKYEDLNFPNYINNRQVFAGLNVSDLARAAVLGGLNLMLVGDAGTGKTQLASDIYWHFFKGNKKEGGNGIFIRADPETDIHNEIFRELNIERGRKDLTDAVEAEIFFVDELNRAPPLGQNQFLGLGDGKMDYHGRQIQIGKDGYCMLVSTANIGNGEFSGTFDTDKALLNRLHVTLDLEHGPFKPTYQDTQMIKRRKANPNVKSAKPRDISGKIIQASRDIGDMTLTPDLETRAVFDYLEQGLNNCQRYPEAGKDRAWPLACQDCTTYNKDGDALCSMIKPPTTRTMEAVRKYIAALNYLAKLKDPKVEIKPHELAFKAFEITGAYQHLLNQSKLREHYNHNPRAMAEVVDKLKTDYEGAREYIMASMEMAQRGESTTRFYQDGAEFGLYDKLGEKARKKVDLVEPYTNNRAVGLAWMPELIQVEIEEAARKE